MLARAARSLRHSARHGSANSEQLLLHRVRSGQVRCTVTTASRGRALSVDRIGRRLSLDGGQRHDRRELGTATAYQPTVDPVPLLYPSTTYITQTQQPRPSLSTLRPWDPSQPFALGESGWTQLPTSNRTLGLGGDTTELFQNLYACLRVHRLGRVENIIKLIATMTGPASGETISAHVAYIRYLVEGLESAESPRSHELTAVQKWFERDMKPTCTPSADAYALMCRAALAVQTGAQRDRTLRRYLVLANGDGLYEDTLDSQELTDAQADMLEQVYSGRSADRLLAEFEPQTTVHKPSTLTFHRLSSGKQFKIESVEQKGYGLETLNRTLHYVNNPEAIDFPHHAELTARQKEDFWATRRQEAIEMSVADEALKRWRHEHEQMQKMGISTALKSKPIAAMLWQWHQELETQIKQELKEIRAELDDPKTAQEQHCAQRSHQRFGVFMETLSAEQLSALTIIQTMRTVAMNGVGEPSRLSSVTSAIGNALADQARYKQQSKSSSRVRSRAGLVNKQTGHKKASTAENDGATTPLPQSTVSSRIVEQHAHDWPTKAKHWVAASLLSKLLDVAKIHTGSSQENDTPKTKEPALKHEIIFKSGHRFGIVRVHEKLQEMLGREPVKGILGASLPMIVEPRPWTSYNEGGFLSRHSELVRNKHKSDTQRLYTVAASEKGNLDQVFEGLNILGKVPWRINQDTFKVMVEAWNTGKAIGDIAPLNPDLPYPPEPASSDWEARKVWLRKKIGVDHAKAGYHSDRCFQNFQLEIARAFLDEVFYCPHNMDFRGRVYPLPPYLNHMGADLARGLMIFANGKPLGKTGLRWLKIHLANVFGYDKASLQERENFAMEHMDDVRDSVNNPLNGRKWWLKADDPWQCLSTCFELKNALESPDPEQFISHMPIHQDGTCNGLQHYAALGGDEMGAKQVNLEPGDKPADIYTGVAQLVIAEINKDADAGDERALRLQGKITRKVVKQTVMTNVYGVTFVGARLQVMKQLEDLYPEDDVYNYKHSIYITHKIFNALGTIFTGAQKIQSWLGQCADRISTTITHEQLELIARRDAGEDTKGSKSKTPSVRKFVRKSRGISKLTDEFRSCVVWTTPLKMPVVQPYRSEKLRSVHTTLQDITLSEPKLNDPVAKRKQLQAFPPNFVHSLDATHMMLSAIKCNELGLTFASVHDSFWTHAVDVPVMNNVLRDAFVLMHSEDIIGRLAAEFKARYKNGLYLTSVYASSPVGQAISEFRLSKGYSSKAMDPNGKRGKAELLEEYKRQKMLRSKNAEERKEAVAMQTPASIFEAAADAASFQPTATFGVVQLGAMSAGDAATVEMAETAVADTDAAEPAIAEEEEDHEREADEAAEAEASTRKPAPGKRRKRTNKKPEPRIHLWLPLTFPEVPAKGTFDVRRLKESQYFFS